MKKYIILMVMLLSCNAPPQPSVENTVVTKNFFTLTDYKDVVHKYDKPIIIQNLERDTLYCKVCNRWEVIRAVWISDKDDYDYFVGPHHKE